MMAGYSTQRMLTLRRITRSMADVLRQQLKEYLSTVSPLLRPKSVFGDYVQGGAKELVRGADVAFKDLQALYEVAASTKPFDFPRELKPPIEILSSTLEITPMEYGYEAKSEPASKVVSVSSPFKWILSYSGFTPGKFADLLVDAGKNSAEIQSFILHSLVLNVVISRQQGVARMFEALHFPFCSEKLPISPGLSSPSLSSPSLSSPSLSWTCISSCVSTVRPPDDVIIESTEVSGTDAFEEVVNLDDLKRIREPLKEQLVNLARAQGGDLPAE
jgi:hypothetical protein